MNAESKINVHYSSLVGLKAELLRKQAEVQDAKAKLQNDRSIKKPKSKDKKIDEKQKKKELEENERTNETEDIESMKALKKSKLMLQAKSRLYEKLSKTHTNMNPNFLVDFEHKSDHSEEEIEKKDDDSKSDYDSDGEWVEYTDCFGRTRKCLREDLPKMQEKDESVRKKIVEKPDEEIREKLYVEDRIPEKEPEIEIMRRKWEEQTAKLADKADIHYQDVLFDEARTHGVGYFAFSQDEEERAKQQENLFKLRKETEEKQKENQQIRNLKDKMQQNRLRVARLRQRIRAGLPPEEPDKEMVEDNAANSSNPNDSGKQETDASDKEKDSEENSKTSSKNSKQEIVQKKLENIENKIEAFEEMLGKRNRWYVMTQEEWVHKKRKERNDEFAPTYNNFQPGGTLELGSSTNRLHENSRNVLDTSDSPDSDTIGPMPPSQDDSDMIRPIPQSQIDSSFIGPVPPCTVGSDIIGPILSPATGTAVPPSSTGQTADSNVTIAYQVEAGLKYLRQQFENKHT